MCRFHLTFYMYQSFQKSFVNCCDDIEQAFFNLLTIIMTPVVILATTNIPLLIKVILNLRIFYKSIFEDDATLQRLANYQFGFLYSS